jgi:hypothetical protein
MTSTFAFYAGVEYLKEKNPKKIKNMSENVVLSDFEDDGG